MDTTPRPRPGRALALVRAEGSRATPPPPAHEAGAVQPSPHASPAPTSGPVRFLLVGPFGLTRPALGPVLDDRAAHRVGGEAGTRREAVAAAQPAEVIVLDADLAGGLEALAARLAALPTPELLALGRAVSEALWETSDDLLEPIAATFQVVLCDRYNREARRH